MNLILHNPQHVGFETDCRRLKAGVERVLKAGKVKRKYVCMLLWSPLFFLHNRVFYFDLKKNDIATQIRTRDLGGYATTREFTQAVISAIR